MSQRNDEPLGIRKIDVQKERRVMERVESKEDVERVARRVWHITDPETIRFAVAMYCTGWERGVTVGVTATKNRVTESLGNGKLVKP